MAVSAQAKVTLPQIFGDNMVKLDSAKELVEQGLELVNGNSNFNYSVKGSGVSEDTSREDNNESDNNPNETNDESLQEDSSDVEEYRNDDVEAMQVYFAKLQAEAEKAVAAEEEERQARFKIDPHRNHGISARHCNCQSSRWHTFR